MKRQRRQRARGECVRRGFAWSRLQRGNQSLKGEVRVRQEPEERDRAKRAEAGEKAGEEREERDVTRIKCENFLLRPLF